MEQAAHAKRLVLEVEAAFSKGEQGEARTLAKELAEEFKSLALHTDKAPAARRFRVEAERLTTGRLTYWDIKSAKDALFLWATSDYSHLYVSPSGSYVPSE